MIVIKAAEADVITGSKATFILIDETRFSKKAKAADIFVEIRGSLASRPDGFLLPDLDPVEGAAGRRVP